MWSLQTEGTRLGNSIHGVDRVFTRMARKVS